MFDGDIITYVLMGLIFFLLVIAIWGSVLWVWMMTGPFMAKIIWTVAMAALTLILIAMSLVVAD